MGAPGRFSNVGASHLLPVRTGIQAFIADRVGFIVRLCRTQQASAGKARHETDEQSVP